MYIVYHILLELSKLEREFDHEYPSDDEVEDGETRVDPQHAVSVRQSQTTVDVKGSVSISF